MLTGHKKDANSTSRSAKNEVSMFWQQPTQQDFENVLKDGRFAKFFRYRPEAMFTIFSGSQITRLKISSEKGPRYGERETKTGLNVLLMVITSEVINRDVMYNAEYDFETYELILTKDGLTQTITHWYRRGFRRLTGYEYRLVDFEDQIRSSRFVEEANSLNGLSGAAEYRYTHPLGISLEDIVWYSNLSAGTILRSLNTVTRKCQKKEIRPRTVNSFRPMEKIGVESHGNGSVKRKTFEGWEENPLENGAENRPMPWRGKGYWK